MKKSLLLFAIVGAMIGIGVVLLFYGSQLLNSGMEIEEFVLEPESSVIISTELDLEKGSQGVFAIKSSGEIQNINTDLYDPSGYNINSEIVDIGSFEKTFDIKLTGVYELSISNQFDSKAEVIAGIGYLPEDYAVKLAQVGYILVITGLVGLVVVGIVVFIKRN